MRILPAVLATGLLGVTSIVGSQAAEPDDPSPRRMALTIDDLPAQRARALSDERIRTITTLLVAVLQGHAIPAVGFVNEGKLYRDGKLDPERVADLERWLDAGLELGNHSFSHPDLHRVSLDVFEADVLKGDDVSRPLAERYQLPYRYFRHPFLHTGRDLQAKRAFEKFLTRQGYRVAPVTIDNSEWIFARAYDEALDGQDETLRGRLGEEYLRYMMRMVVYYEDQSRALFERQIPQILLLHANALNAHYLDRLIEALERRGYRFVALDAALEDPAFRSPDTFTGPGGITWLHRWAITREVESSFFDGEPAVASWVEEVAGIEE